MRSRSPDAVRLLLSGAVVDLEAARVWRAGRVIRLGPREIALLRRLAVADGGVVARDALLSEIFGFRAGTRTRALDVAGGRLRGKLELDARRPEHLVTLRGSGYALDLSPTPERVRRAADLCGRAELLITLADAVAEAGFTNVWGPAGVGKTRLVQAYAEIHRAGFEASGGIVRRCDLEGVETIA